ncbi:HIT-like protein [Ramicandelaber brevisporus]|nr:HIT-like protein [Ramicandelaber brevisporus]
MIRETASDYKRIVEPYILSVPTSRIKWIYNALDGISEAEHVIYRDEDLILLPDSKWDKVTMENLYLLVLCTDRTIRSIRDLRGDNAAHMRMLKTVRDKIPSILAADRVKFPGFTGSDQLRMFVHYQPTYYHFHVHLAHVQITGHPGMTAGQAILLDTVIESLEIDPLFYTKCSLTYALADTHDLYNLFQQDQS